MRLRYKDKELLVLCVDGILIFVANAPCAIVPLNPNELSREPLDSVVRGTTSTGIWNGYDDTIDDRCAFSLRKNKVTMDVKHT